MDIKAAISGVVAFFDGDFFHIKSVVDASIVKGQRQTDECRPEFDHCFVDQGGGGFTGDDHHGTVYFHLGGSEYLAVDY